MGRSGVEGVAPLSGVVVVMYVLCRELAFTVDRGEKDKLCEVVGRVGVCGDEAPIRGEGEVRAWFVMRGLGVIGRLFFLRRFWGRLLEIISRRSLSCGTDVASLTFWFPSLSGEVARYYLSC